MHVDFDDSICLFKRLAACTLLRRSSGRPIFAALVAGALGIGPAMAQDAPENDTAAEVRASTPAESSRNGKICRFEDVTGSRMRKRICHTPEQWVARERAAQAAVRELDGKSVAGSADDN